MKSARKHRPGYDDGFFMARTDPEREAKPRIESRPLKIRSKKFRMEDALRAWKAIGLKNNPAHIREHMATLKKWERRYSIKKFKLG